jgi:hypothetical protein
LCIFGKVFFSLRALRLCAPSTLVHSGEKLSPRTVPKVTKVTKVTKFCKEKI